MILKRLTKPVLSELVKKVLPGSEGLEKLTREELIKVLEGSEATNEQLKDLAATLGIIEQVTEQVTEQVDEEIEYAETPKVEEGKKLSLPLKDELLKPKVVKKIIDKTKEVVVPGEFLVLSRLKRNGTIYEKGSILREKMCTPLVVLLKDGIIKPNVVKV